MSDDDTPADLFHQIYRVRSGRFVFVDHAPSKVKRDGTWHHQSFLDHFKLYIEAARLYKRNPSIIQHLAAASSLTDKNDPSPDVDAKLVESAVTDSELLRRMGRYYKDVAAEPESLLVPNNAWEELVGATDTHTDANNDANIYANVEKTVTDRSVEEPVPPQFLSSACASAANPLCGTETHDVASVTCTYCFAEPCACNDWCSEAYEDTYDGTYEDTYEDTYRNLYDTDPHSDSPGGDTPPYDPSNPEDD